jgi:hypothetical protein
MNPGYVYILTNPSMPGLVKIGRTQRNSHDRARELYTTGVPTRFEVAFEISSDDHESLENQMHARLSEFRPNEDREFFRYPLMGAIKLLLQLRGAATQSESSFSAISILGRLKKKYPRWIDPTIADVQIVQTDDRVWLEITRENEIAGYLKDQIIKRSDLAFIAGSNHNENFFPPSDTVIKNARRFTEKFDPYSIIMTTDLFHEAAFHEIDKSSTTKTPFMV